MRLDHEPPEAEQAQPWLLPAWRAEAEAWIDQILASAGLAATAPIQEIHRRIWSVVLQVNTERGACYFKATARALTHEVRQLGLLAAVCPSLAPEVLAIEATRGWSLTRDAGMPLGDAALRPQALELWLAFMPQYAELQCRSMTIAAQLLHAGTFDRQVERLQAQLERLLGQMPASGLPGSLDHAEMDQLVELGHGLASVATELEGIGIPPGIQCDDLHGWNVLLRDQRYRVIDWGDACITHPFGSLLVVERHLAEHLELPAGDPAIGRIREAYLGGFASLAGSALIHRACELALWTAPLVRALTWHEVLLACGEAAYRARGEVVLAKLRHWLAWPRPR